jgi:hypothetical protein
MLIHTRIPATTPNKLQNAAANSRKELARDGRLVTLASLPYRRASRESRAANGVVAAVKRIFSKRWKPGPAGSARCLPAAQLQGKSTQERSV